MNLILSMLSRLLILFFTSTSFVVSAQSYIAADAGSNVKFVIKNFGINTGGSFNGLSGAITFDPANLSICNFEVSVESETVDTDMEARDNHLRKTEYLDVEKFPKIIFKSSKFTKTNKAEYLYLTGNLTIKGVTREIIFPFLYIPKEDGYLFQGEFEINRRDFGVGSKSISLSDNLKIVLSVFAKKG